MSTEIDYTNEEKSNIVSVIEDHPNLGVIFRMALMFRRIEVNEEVLDEYNDDFKELLNQIVSVIQNAVEAYETFGLMILRDVKNENSDDESDLYIANKHKVIYNQNIKEMDSELRAYFRKIGVSNKNILTEGIDYIPEFRNSLMKYLNYKNYGFTKEDRRNMTDTDRIFFKLKNRYQLINKRYTDFLKSKKENDISYGILIDEVGLFIQRINLYLYRKNKLIQFSSREDDGEFLLTFKIVKLP